MGGLPHRAAPHRALYRTNPLRTQWSRRPNLRVRIGYSPLRRPAPGPDRSNSRTRVFVFIALVTGVPGTPVYNQGTYLLLRLLKFRAKRSSQRVRIL